LLLVGKRASKHDVATSQDVVPVIVCEGIELRASHHHTVSVGIASLVDGSLGVVERSQLVLLVGLKNVHLSGNAASSQGMVPCHHDDLDARLVARMDSGRDLLSRRVFEREHPHEAVASDREVDAVGFVSDELEVVRKVWQQLLSEGEHSLTILSHLCIRLFDVAHDLTGQRLVVPVV
jgi:hypothetical protein